MDPIAERRCWQYLEFILQVQNDQCIYTCIVVMLRFSDNDTMAEVHKSIYDMAIKFAVHVYHTKINTYTLCVSNFELCPFLYVELYMYVYLVIAVL